MIIFYKNPAYPYKIFLTILIAGYLFILFLIVFNYSGRCLY